MHTRLTCHTRAARLRASLAAVLAAAMAAPIVAAPVYASPSLQADAAGTNPYASLRAPKSDGHLHVVLASPKGQLRTIGQASELRWVFDRPIIALSAIDQRANDPAKYVRMRPAVEGAFRWASTRVLVFTPATSLPRSTRFTVTLSAVKALDGTTLVAPIDSSFDTPRVQCSQYRTDKGWQSGRASGSILVTCDQPVAGADLAAHTTFAFQHNVDDLATHRPTSAELALMREADPKGAALLEQWLRMLADTRIVERPAVLVRSGACPDSRPRRTCHWLSAKARDDAATADLPLDADVQLRFRDGITSTSGPLTSVAIPAIESRTPPVLLASVSCRIDCDPDGGVGLGVRGDVDPERFDGKITVRALDGSGKPGRAVTYQKRRDEFGSPLSLGWAKLEPTTAYRIEIDPTVEDANGRQLGYRFFAIVTTGHRRAYISLPSGEFVNPAVAAQITIPIRNVTKVDRVVRALTVDDVRSVLVGLQSSKPEDALGLGRDSTPVALPDALDNVTTLDIPLAAGGPGTYLVAVRATAFAPKSTYGTTSAWQIAVVQQGDRGVTIKRSPTDVLVAISSLTTGKAIAGGGSGDRIDLAVVEPGGSIATPYWSGATVADGFAKAPAPTCESCEVIAMVRSANGAELAYGRTSWVVGGGPFPFEDGVRPVSVPSDGGVAVPAPSDDTATLTVPTLPLGRRWIGALFTDRGVYKAGEEVHARGRLRIEQPRGLDLPARGLLSKVGVIVTDDSGTTVWTGTSDVDARGGFDAVFTLSATARQGSYIVSALGGIATTSFLSTTYRRPDFKVDVAIDQPTYVLGTAITGSSTGTYLFGAAMSGLSAKWVATASATSVDPTDKHPELGLNGYNWSYVCIWYEGCTDATLNGQIGTLDATLDADGKQAVRVDVPVNPKRHLPVNVTVEGIVTNVDRQVIANRATTLVHVGEHYLGIKRTDYFGTVGTPLRAQVAAVTTDGKWKPDVGIKATLLRWDWAANRATSDAAPTSTVVATVELRSGIAPMPVALSPDRPGTYELRIESTDSRGNHIEAGTTAYVLGQGATFGPSSDNSLELVASADTYAVGEAADVLVKTPWTTAEGILTIERDDVLSYTRFSVTGGAAALHVPITADAVPNIYASVVLFRTAPAVPGSDGQPARAAHPEVQSTSVSLRVPPVTRRLGVQVSADQTTYRPGSSATVNLRITDAAGAPALGSVTLWAVDEGVLRLTGYELPDLLSSLWPERPDRVLTADGRTRAQVLDAVKEEKFESKNAAKRAAGGGAADSESVAASASSPAPLAREADGTAQPGEQVTLRTDFRVLATWQGAVDVGTDGRASVPIKLPQSLTSYRILAVADSGGDRFGGGSTVVEIRQPFMVQPALPRFVAVGDTFEAGAVLQNQSGKAGSASLTLDLPAGSPLVIDGPATQTITLAPGPTEVRFHLRADHLGNADGVLKGTLTGGGTGRNESDAVQVSIPVLVTHRLETVAAAGQVKATPDGKAGGSGTGQEVEQITLPTGVTPNQGGLEITAATSALVGLQNGVDYLVEYPYGCLEQRSSRLRALIMLRDLRDRFPLPSLAGERFDQAIAAEMSRIRNYLTPNGGLAYWEGSNYADVYLSARVLLLLLDARDLGVAVPTDVIDRVTVYLQGIVERVKSESLRRPLRDVDGVWPNRAYVLYALARSGKPDTDLMAKLWSRRTEMPVLEQINLLNAMVLGNMKGIRANQLYGELLSSVRVEADQAFLQDDQSHNSWDKFVCPCASYLYAADTHDTAELLSLLVKADPANPLAPQMARWLLAQRDKQGRWANTLENGYALTALVNYYRAAESTPPNLRAEVLLGSTRAYDQVFSGRSLAAQAAALPMPQLAATLTAQGGSVPLTVKATGTGTLFWTARLRYEPDTKELKALDAGFSVQRTYLPYTGGAVATTFGAGDLVRVQLTVRTEQARRNVVVDDPIPAGLEPLDARLTSTARTEIAGGAATSDATWSGIDHVEIRDERVLLFATGLEPGTFTYTYVARAVAPGTFIAAPTQAEEMYRPEIFGRSATATMVITPPR